MTSLPAFDLEVHLSRWEFAAKHHLTASDAQSLSLRELLDLARAEDREAFENVWLGYTETRGAEDLRSAVAGTYASRSASDILCFAGAEEGLYATMNVLLASDDHAIVLTPNYQSAEAIPASICSTTGVPLDEDLKWSLDLDRLAREIRPNTRLVSINFPHNPTGKILERQTFEGLVGLCRRHGLWLFSDEVYRPLGPVGAVHLPQVADVYERGISLGVMSKAYGLPGLRIGWVACQDADLIERLERFKHYLSICNAAPAERLAVIALKAREAILTGNRRIVSANLDGLDAFFSRHSRLFEWSRPDGGCVAFPRYHGIEGVESFTARLLQKAGVLLLPSSIYRSRLAASPTDRFRIGVGRLHFREGLAALERHILEAKPA